MSMSTNAEMADMHYMFGRSNDNAYVARRLYAGVFLNRVLPSNKILTRLHQTLSTFDINNRGT